MTNGSSGTRGWKECRSVTGNLLAIKGQFISIDEGNRTERVVIGLGLGRTDVKTLIQVYDHNDGARTLCCQFETDAKSGRKPGMAETMGAGAATGNLVTSAAVGGGLTVTGSETVSAALTAGSLHSTGATAVDGNLTVSGGTVSLANGTSNVLTFTNAGVNPPAEASTGWKGRPDSRSTLATTLAAATTI